MLLSNPIYIHFFRYTIYMYISSETISADVQHALGLTKNIPLCQHLKIRLYLPGGHSKTTILITCRIVTRYQYLKRNDLTVSSKSDMR